MDCRPGSRRLLRGPVYLASNLMSSVRIPSKTKQPPEDSRLVWTALEKHNGSLGLETPQRAAYV